MPAARSELPDIVCLSHLRWDLVYQRPQHLMERAARERRVFYVEEPVWGSDSPRLHVSDRPEGVKVVAPHLPDDVSEEVAAQQQSDLLLEWIERAGIKDYVLWYYTPMALSYSRNLEPLATVFDCMDELSMFRGAPPGILEMESELFRRADVVFTGGRSLFEAKQDRHPNVHLFPSSVDREHFQRARTIRRGPPDQAILPAPRLGYFGVIDERMDLELLAGVADARPDWQWVMIGPVVKVDPSELPRRPNLHFLGRRPYDELPAYVAGWDVALIPFALNDSTRFISPTKTPEYLAAGRPVVSTPIRDVAEPYGAAGLVRIAATVPEFIEAVEMELARDARGDWLREVDRFLARTSWDRTWEAMADIMDALAGTRRPDDAGLTLYGPSGTEVARHGPSPA